MDAYRTWETYGKLLHMYLERLAGAQKLNFRAQIESVLHSQPILIHHKCSMQCHRQGRYHEAVSMALVVYI